MTEQKTTTQTRGPSRGFKGCLLAILAVPAVLVGLYAYEGPLPTPPLWQIERVAKIKFPGSARLIRSHGRTFLETTVWAKVEIDKSDVPPFIKSLPAGSEVNEPSTKEHNWAADFFGDKYNPMQCRLFEYSKEDKANAHHECWKILVKPVNTQKVLVYLFYSYF